MASWTAVVSAGGVPPASFPKDGRQDTENQLIALRDYCAKQRWRIVGEYVDHETGGALEAHALSADVCRCARSQV
jgi:hypothetical protein